MNKVYVIISVMAFSAYISSAISAYATQSPQYGSKYAVTSYCNDFALKRLYAYMDERYRGEVIPAAEQYSILDEQFSKCLNQEGYQISRDLEPSGTYNYLFQ